MGSASTRRMNLVFAVICFILSFCGFTGMLEGAGKEANPMHLGILFLLGGIFFLFSFIKQRDKR